MTIPHSGWAEEIATPEPLDLTQAQAHPEGMLKRATLLLLAAALLATFCHAQKSSTDDQKTNGLLNGRFWTVLGDSSKLVFVLGYCEAAVGLAVPCPSQSEFGEIVKGIDRFYQEPENLRLPFMTAQRVFAMKVAGASATEIEAVMNAAREYAERPQPKIPPPPK
jgi:hypothetical protein